MNNTILVVRWAHRAECPGTFAWDRLSFCVSVTAITSMPHIVCRDHPAVIDASLSQTNRPVQLGTWDWNLPGL